MTCVNKDFSICTDRNNGWLSDICESVKKESIKVGECPEQYGLVAKITDPEDPNYLKGVTLSAWDPAATNGLQIPVGVMNTCCCCPNKMTYLKNGQMRLCNFPNKDDLDLDNLPDGITVVGDVITFNFA